MSEPTPLPPDVQAAIDAVAHPEIDSTLNALGMLHDLTLDESGENVELTLLLPILNIPEQVRNFLAQSLYDAVNAFGYGLRVRLGQMSEAQRQHFFSLAQQNWKAE